MLELSWSLPLTRLSGLRGRDVSPCDRHEPLQLLAPVPNDDDLRTTVGARIVELFDHQEAVQAIKDGVSALSIKNELLSLEARKAELQARLNAPEMPELLHPRMADVHREKVGSLCLALGNEQSRTGAADAIRAVVEATLLEPDGGQLKITLKGDLAGVLSSAETARGRQIPATSWSK